MIGYVTLGTNDKTAAFTFYDELLSLLGAKRLYERDDRGCWWGISMEQPLLGLVAPQDGNAATVGNGVMIALSAGSKEMVEKLHAKALALGGRCEGEPGFRSDNFYGAYFRDLDGNKLAVFCFAEG